MLAQYRAAKKRMVGIICLAFAVTYHFTVCALHSISITSLSNAGRAWLPILIILPLPAHLIIWQDRPDIHVIITTIFRVEIYGDGPTL